MNDQLKKLAGMAYHGGKTVDHWKKTTGVDPSKVREIQVRCGLCYWTPMAEKQYRRHVDSIKMDYAAIGIR